VRIQSLFVDAGRSIIMDKEAQDHEFTETSTLESGRETPDHRRGSGDRQHSKRSMPAIRDRAGQFYVWEKYARQGALSALRNGKRGRKESKREETLKSEVERLRAVIAELSMENSESFS
jgi:hypothetical protein